MTHVIEVDFMLRRVRCSCDPAWWIDLHTRTRTLAELADLADEHIQSAEGVTLTR